MVPPFPIVPAAQQIAVDLPLRYDDIRQDGRFRPSRLPMVFGPTTWQLVVQHPLEQALQRDGVVPILTRLVCETLDGPVSVLDPVHVDAGYEVAHALAADGSVDRLLLRMWATITGRKGRTYPPQPRDVGEVVALGRTYAENTFTRLFAPPGQRKVTSLAGIPERPGSTIDVGGFTVPPGASRLDREPVDGPAWLFGVDDTDSNHHVNSLAYPDRFIIESHRRFVELERPVAGCRAFDVRYHKPVFAGERRVPKTSVYEDDGRLGVLGSLGGEGERPYCTIGLEFAP